MNYNYVHCIKDGLFNYSKKKESVSSFKFSKKRKCYRVIWERGDVNFPNCFINEQKNQHFFGKDSESTYSFFNTNFKTPEFKHLIIEKKI